MQARVFYKVLLEGQSFHGGNHVWSLPQNGQPGEWHEVQGAPVLCKHGFHLTDKPSKWWKHGARCFLTEYEEPGAEESEDAKIVVRKVRLVREATKDELAALGIVSEGHHQLNEGFLWAYGSASVEASGSARVSASGSARVSASGSASVSASGSARVSAYDSARVEAYGSASVSASGSARVSASGSARVEAYGSASVSASGSARVSASGSASVEASGSASVEAKGKASVVSHWGKPTVKLTERATHVDQSGDAPVLYTADGRLCAVAAPTT